MSLVCVIEPANHCREEDADPKLEIAFTRKADDHEVRAAKLALDLKGIFGLHLVRDESGPQGGGEL